MLEENLENLSDLERRAEIASRQVNQQMICYQLEKFIGDELSTIVVGITEFGLFCEIENYFISGEDIIFDNKNSVIADPTSDACEFSRKNFSLIPSLKFDTSI